jgi:hypothetical protein
MRIFIILVNLVGWVLATSVGMAAEAFNLEILWSAPITSDRASHESVKPTTGLMLEAQSTSPEDLIASLATLTAAGVRSQLLFNDIDQNRLDDAVTLTLKGALPSGKLGFLSKIFSGSQQVPYVSALAAGTSGSIWVGGSTNGFHDIASAPHSDAYLAKVSTTGTPIWEMAYGNGGLKTIWGIAWLPTGDVAVVGLEGRSAWVARIGSDGRQRWERLLGNDLGGAVAMLPGNRLAVVGFQAAESDQKIHQNDVIVWILDDSGKQLTQTRVRDSINKSKNSYFGRVSLVTSGDAIYVASNWAGIFDARPVEIAKLSSDGKLLWSALLPDTVISTETTVRTWTVCKSTFALIPTGGILVACALNNRIQLYELDQKSGAYTEHFLPLPACQAAHPADLFLNIRKDGTITLSGSRPSNNVAPGCTWIGRLTKVR